jgi:MoaA/NifB/PqqE/SkfB family radical SAM enzyme
VHHGRPAALNAGATPLPRDLQVETSSRCNSRCATCLHGLARGRERERGGGRDLGLATFQRILDRFPELDRVLLHGVGEPSLNPALPQMVRSARNRGARVLLNTNALALGSRLQSALVDAGLNEIRVSMDASTRQGYRAARGVDGLPRVIRNLFLFKHLRTTLRKRPPELSLWFTARRGNLAELPGLVSLAAAVGARAVHVQRLVLLDRGLAVVAESLHGRLGAEERATLRRSSDIAREAGVELSASGRKAPETSLAVAGPADEARSSPPCSACRRPSESVYVDVAGNVLPCCMAPWTAALAGSAPPVLGQLPQDSLHEILGSPRHRAFRAALNSPEPPSICRRCAVDWSL